ncbi:MAG TPA: type II toxin-antitoxin system VapC family toxin [Blastocatellia bacterium]|nr:type II toxin-antitoxin system VapC family toxin [Blastocatellia bacterium]
MAVYFFDSSAIVKGYLNETGTSWVINIIDPASHSNIYLARITLVEVVSAITRKARGTGLSTTGAAKAIADFRQDFMQEYALVEQTPLLIEQAAALAEAHVLRANDAIQLAAAIYVNAERLSLGLSEILLVSSDAELNAAAVIEGLVVDDPNAHP